MVAGIWMFRSRAFSALLLFILALAVFPVFFLEAAFAAEIQ